MATNLKASQIAALKEIGITGVKTEEAARTKLIKILNDNDVDNVDDESLPDLIQMAEAFADTPQEEATTEEEEEVQEEEEELDELAEEVEEEEEAPEEEEEEVAPTLADILAGLDRTELKAHIKENSLDVKVMKSDSDDDIRDKIIAASGEEEEVEEEVEVPVKKGGKAAAPAKTSTKKEEAKPAAKKPAVVRDANNVTFDARNNEEHAAYLEVFREIFPADEYEIKILKQGFTVRLLGDNAQTTIVNFDELRIIDGEYLKGNLYCNRLKNVEELEGFLSEDLLAENEVPSKKGVEYVPVYPRGMFRSETHPSIKGVTQAQMFEILGLEYDKKAKEWTFTDEGYLNEALNRANGTDKKMGENREKMEQKLEQSKAAPAKGKAAPVVKKK